jgi:choline dehydrogenase-like flavoprotein
VTHIAYRDEPFTLDADYVVVGSGAGGATAANTLARGGATVALVEAGPWRDPEHYPHSAYGAMRDLFDDFGAGVAQGRALWPIVQALCVGGTTVINCAICVRTPEDIFDQWEREHGVAQGSFRDTIWAHQERLEHELCAELVPGPSAGRSSELAMQGANAMGYHSHVMTRYAKGCVGSGQCLQGCRSLRKQSLNLQFIPEVLAKGGYVVSCAPVDKVLFQGRRATAVTGHFRHPQTRRKGGRFTVRARKAVVVAASVTHSAPILERSGVRNPALGTGFRAHPGTGIFGIYDDVIDMNVGATQGWASTEYRVDPGMKLETLSIPPEMVASRLSGVGHELMARLGEYRHMAMWVLAVRAESVGTVRNGFFNKPVVKYGFDRADMLRLRAGMGIIARTHFAAGAKRIVPGIFGLPYEITADQLSLIDEAPLDPRAYIAILSHLFGGCPMGKDPRRSVVDESGRVHGYEGLLVADASVIPTNLGVNPQHTIMALARTFMERQLDA